MSHASGSIPTRLLGAGAEQVAQSKVGAVAHSGLGASIVYDFICVFTTLITPEYKLFCAIKVVNPCPASMRLSALLSKLSVNLKS